MIYQRCSGKTVQVEVLEEFFEFFELPQTDEDYEKFKNSCTGVANE
jgi:hypothetical protein